MPGASGEKTNDQCNRIKWRTELYKAKSKDSKYKDDIKEPGLLSRWPKFLDLEMEMASAGETVALGEIRKMCPGKPATLEEIEEISKETPFYTPFWKGQTTDTDIPARPLEPAEVDVINRKYLALKAAFDAKRSSQNPTESIMGAENRVCGTENHDDDCCLLRFCDICLSLPETNFRYTSFSSPAAPFSCCVCQKQHQQQSQQQN